jgi:voltage-gated potassium channel
MKTIASQVAAFLGDAEARSNVRLLVKLFAFVVVVVIAYTVIFQLLMIREGRDYSWITSVYWTLTVMSTLGFGDIVFHGDLGRIFSVVVLLSGITLLLVVLPFAFIQFFYAPWLQTRVRLRAPRELPRGTSGHIIVCEMDPVGQGLVQRLADRRIPHAVIISDTTQAATMHREGIAVVTGEPDDVEFLRRLHVEDARLVFANREDTANTNIALTVREVSPSVPIAAVASREESTDVLELSGVDHVLPLKRWLGEQLANRVGGSHAQSQVVGRYHDLLLAEVPIRNTPLAHRTVRDSRLRQGSGVSVVGVWNRGRLVPARPEMVLTEQSVAVVSGTRDQLDALDEMLLIYNFNPNPVLVVGGGRVGLAAARAMQRKSLPVHILERDAQVAAAIGDDINVFVGDAANYGLLARAGIREAPAVLLSTHDDAMNIYLASYCRRLNPDLRIISRVTHERNVEAVHRAGADFALSYTTLGVAAVLSTLDNRELVVLGGMLDLFTVDVPHALVGKTLAESGIGARTGLLVLAVEDRDERITNPPATTTLHAGAEMVLIGDDHQRRLFEKAYDA